MEMSLGMNMNDANAGYGGGGGWWFRGASLDMDFANNKVYGAPSFPLTVTRASSGYAQTLSGSWVSFSPNVLRRTDKGALIEEGRVNLFLNSLAPSTQSITVSAATVYTVTLFSVGGTLTLSGATTGTVNPNVPVTFTAGTNSLTVTVNSPTGSFQCVNVEAGAFGTSPISTAASSATRNGDQVTVNSASSYINYSQGSIYTQFNLDSFASDRVAWGARLDVNNYMRSYVSVSGGAKPSFQVLNAGVPQVSLTSTNVMTPSNSYKQAVRWATNDCAMKVTPSLGSPPDDTTATMISGTITLAVGQSGANSQHVGGYIGRISLFNTAQTNAQLSAMVA